MESSVASSGTRSAAGRPDVALVVPCFNEAERLDGERFARFLEKNPSVAFVFVDDGSTDATMKRLESLRDVAPDRVDVLRLERNCGKAEAVRCGLLRAFHAAEEYVGYWDADLATPLEAIDDLRSVLEERPSVDLVLGARVRLLGRAIERNAARHYLGRVFATAVSTVLGSAVYDTQCGAKLLRAKPWIRELFEEPFLSRWIFDVEIIARLLDAHEGDRYSTADDVIHEYPLREWRDVRGSKLRPADYAGAAWDLLRIYRTSGQPKPK